jgi:hypothetical protein
MEISKINGSMRMHLYPEEEFPNKFKKIHEVQNNPIWQSRLPSISGSGKLQQTSQFSRKIWDCGKITKHQY